MSTLTLYKELLRVVSKWPSRNRLKIREEIRLGFREHRSETDGAKLDKLLTEARAGLQSMKTQIGWKDSSEIGNTSGILKGIKPAAGE